MLRLVGGVLLIVSATAQAGAEPAPGPAGPEQIAQHEYYLAAAAEAGDPLSDWLLADMFARSLEFSETGVTAPMGAPLAERHAEERDRLLARADAALNDDPAMLSARLPCYGERLDDGLCAARRARLAQIDGDNAATAVVLMAAAWGAGDNAGFAEAAARGAQATRYDTAARKALDSLRTRFNSVPDTAVPGMPLVIEGFRRGDVLAMAVSSAWTMPPFQHFGQPCRESEGELLQNCLAIARRMLRNGESIIEAYIGSELLSRRGTDADRKEVHARRRELAWLQDRALSEIEGPRKLEGTILRDYFDTYASEGEVAAMRSVLRTRDIPLMPPDDWVAPGRWGSP